MPESALSTSSVKDSEFTIDVELCLLEFTDSFSSSIIGNGIELLPFSFLISSCSSEEEEEVEEDEGEEEQEQEE